jgi:tetratricopeptide (TPR) repeat protein
LVKQIPDDSLLASELGAIINNLAIKVSKRGRNEEAAQLYRQAIEQQRSALAQDPRNSRYQQFLHNHYVGLGHALRATNQPAEAIAPLREALKLDPRSSLAHYHLACCWAAQIPKSAPGKPLTAAEQTQAEQLALQAVAALQDAVRHGYDDWQQLRDDPALAPLRSRPDYQELLAKSPPDKR